jgi:hypothetical protein
MVDAKIPETPDATSFCRFGSSPAWSRGSK